MLLLLIAALLSTTGSCINQIDVDPRHGVNNESCWIGEHPCRTLDMALQGAIRVVNVSIRLQSGDYEITYPYSFIGKESFVVTVQQENGSKFATIVCPVLGAGVGFFNSTGISFQNVRFVGCGAVRNSTSRDPNKDGFLKFQVALYFLLCTEVTMENVSVTQSNGTGLVLYSTVGQNSFTRCNFTENIPGNRSKFAGGGGVNIEFPYCSPGSTDCFKSNFTPSSDHSSDSSYTFYECLFSGNIAETDSYIKDSFVIPAGAYSIALGRGGGLSLFFKGVASNNNVTIVDSHFQNNSAVWGAGMEAIFEDFSTNNSVQILSSHFIDNSCSYKAFTYEGTGGGGARVYFAGLTARKVKSNKVMMSDSVFHNNTAYFGGGISFYTTLELGEQTASNSIVFINCSWTNNTARLGSAIDMAVWHETTEGVGVKPNLTNCSFEGNTVHYTDLLGAPAGIGTIYTDSVDIIFHGTLNVSNNYGTGIASLDAGLKFMPKSLVNFTANIGRNGGAIAMFGYAYIKVYSNTLFMFLHNKAQILGGALYWESIGGHELISSRNCFIRYSDAFTDPTNWTTQLIFRDNTASLSGDAIYATTLLTCLWGGSPYGTLNTSLVEQYDKVFCWNNNSLIWDYGSSSCQNSIATATAGFSNVIPGKAYNLSTIPGEYTHLPVSMVDDRNKTIPPREQILSVEMNGTLSYQAYDKIEFRPVDTDNKGMNLKVETLQPRVLATEVIVEFAPCPPGFVLNQTSVTCEFGNYPYIETDVDYKTKIHRGYWIGNSASINGTMVSGECIYCASDPRVFRDGEFIDLPKNPNETDSKLCKPLNRTGILCGRCVENFAPAVNSKYFQCVPCTSDNQRYSWLLYILSEFVPITILLIIVILFNVSVTSGPGNAFVFFAQVISSTFGVDGDGTFNYQSVTSASGAIKQVYFSLYDIWNLNFFDAVHSWQFCLNENLTTLQLRALDYLTAVYPLVVLSITLVIVGLYEHENRVVVCVLKPLHRLLARFRRRWNFRRSIVHAIGTFLVLSFTKFAIISAYITYPAAVYDENNTVFDLVCYVYGDFKYFSAEYAPYLIISILIFLTVCVLMPLILLLYSLKPFYTCLGRLKLNFLQPGPKFQHLLNVFYNCYKDGTDGTHDLRFFASLYFGLRVLMILIYPVAPTWASQYIMQQVLCTMGIFLFAALQPYKNGFYNFVDAAAFSLLAVINVIAFYNRYLAAVGFLPSPLTYWLQTALIFIPLIYILSYLTVYFCKAQKDTLRWLFWRICCCRKKGKPNWGILSSGRNFEQSFGSFMDSMVAAGEWRGTINYYGPVPTPEVNDDGPAENDDPTSVHLKEPQRDEDNTYGSVTTQTVSLDD